MGYWSYALFGNDVDADQLLELAEEAGVDRIDYPDDDKLVSVRKKLNSGILKKMITKYKNPNRKNDSYIESAPYGSKHHSVCILAAAAMTTGAHFDKEDLDHLKTVYKDAGLFDIGAGQFGEALKGYKNDGTPWDFNKSKWCEVDRKKCEDEIEARGGHMLNVYPEGTMAGSMAGAFQQFGQNFMENMMGPRKQQTDLAAMLKAMVEGKPVTGQIPEQTHCAKCWKVETHVKKLMACGKCRVMKYCGRECQAGNWEEHKKICKGIVMLRQKLDAQGGVDVDVD